VAQLDDALLLENERSDDAKQSRLAQFREQPVREPALAGLGYPTDPFELTTQFLAFGEGDDLSGWKPWRGRGIISPHIDYQRGGRVYSQIWQRAEVSVKEADLVLIFGTDHNGSNGSITLTSKPYATPFGTMPTDPEVVQDLAEAIGPEAFDEELHHRTEHSVELSAVWLHYMRDRNPCPMVPILCGSYQHFVNGENQPSDDAKIAAFVHAARKIASKRKVLAVASVDLAHVGPSFGDDFAMNSSRRGELVQSDSRLIESIKAGDSARFYREIVSVEDKNRVCGFSSIYLLLRFLGPTSGVEIAYEHCPADQQNASLVSICGLLLD
jgi:AmmeMemoRadiSam system protein B